MVSVMKCLSFFLGASLLLYARIHVTPSSQTLSREPKKRVALFVFGDSPYDPGNNNFLNISIEFKANYPPYGETFFKFPTGRFCDGRLIPDFIAKYANLPYWKPYLAPGQHDFINGANFASGGVTQIQYAIFLYHRVWKSKFSLFKFIVFSLKLPDHVSEFSQLNLEIQLSDFKKVAGLLKQQLGDAEAQHLLMNAVYLSSIGGVDYWIFRDTYPNATEAEKQEYVQLVIGNITDVVTKIYNIGGRKFAFQNVAPLGCSPVAKQLDNLSKTECLEDLQELATLHNRALVTAATELEIQLPAFKYIIFDYFSAVMDLIFNPLKYGFKEADIACCGSGIYSGTDCGIGDYNLCSNPNVYVYFDGEHLTEEGNSLLAEKFWNGGGNVTAPFNMKQLFELEHYEIKKFSERKR